MRGCARGTPCVPDVRRGVCLCPDSLEAWGGYTRHTFNAKCTPYDLTSTYYPAFKRAVTSGNAMGVMCSYNEVNGIPSCANQFMNMTLRGKWCVFAPHPHVVPYRSCSVLCGIAQGL